VSCRKQMSGRSRVIKASVWATTRAAAPHCTAPRSDVGDTTLRPHLAHLYSSKGRAVTTSMNEVMLQARPQYDVFLPPEYSAMQPSSKIIAITLAAVPRTYNYMYCSMHPNGSNCSCFIVCAFRLFSLYFII
jgi:hypothetical protein